MQVMQPRDKVGLSAPASIGFFAISIAFTAMSIASGLEKLFADTSAIGATVGFLVLAYGFGWTLGALIEETIWYRAKISPLKRNEILWGWSAVVAGVLAALILRTLWVTVSYSLLTMVIVTFVIWGGQAFALLLLNARTVTAMVPEQ